MTGYTISHVTGGRRSFGFAFVAFTATLAALALWGAWSAGPSNGMGGVTGDDTTQNAPGSPEP